jgi:hypothetical protein
VKRLVALIAAVAVTLVLGACSSSNNNTGGGSDATAIRNRVNSVITHFNNGDGKAILDNDVPASARRTCSDKDAKDLVNGARQQLQTLGVKLSVKSVDNIVVTGNKATADVTLGGIPASSSFPVTFVKDGSSWRLDTSAASGCNGLLINQTG